VKAVNMTDNEYVYEIIDNETDAYYCAQLIADEFSAHNPITIFDQITSKDFFDKFSWPLMKDMFDERLSFLARHCSSGEIIAAVAAGDLYTYHQKHPYDVSSPPQTVPVSDLLDEMEESFILNDFGEELKPKMVLHITVAAVRDQYSGKGIASQLNQIMCDYARDKEGFKYALVQVTNQVTKHIYVNKMNGKEVTIVDPTTWIWKKKGNELLCPYKDYQGGSIPNILIKLKSEGK
jgi:ribosomal protein S18 acetylase RimI-like enzyme